MTEVKNQISFFASRTNSTAYGMYIRYSSTCHLDRTNLSSCIDSSFTIKWAFDTRIQRSKQFEEYMPGQKKIVVYEYLLACKLPSTWAFPPTFFLTWQQLRASIFSGMIQCSNPHCVQTKAQVQLPNSFIGSLCHLCEKYENSMLQLELD